MPGDGAISLMPDDVLRMLAQRLLERVDMPTVDEVAEACAIVADAMVVASREFEANDPRFAAGVDMAAQEVGHRIRAGAWREHLAKKEGE